MPAASWLPRRQLGARDHRMRPNCLLTTRAAVGHGQVGTVARCRSGGELLATGTPSRCVTTTAVPARPDRKRLNHTTAIGWYRPPREAAPRATATTPPRRGCGAHRSSNSPQPHFTRWRRGSTNSAPGESGPASAALDMSMPTRRLPVHLQRRAGVDAFHRGPGQPCLDECAGESRPNSSNTAVAATIPLRARHSCSGAGSASMPGCRAPGSLLELAIPVPRWHRLPDQDGCDSIHRRPHQAREVLGESSRLPQAAMPGNQKLGRTIAVVRQLCNYHLPRSPTPTEALNTSSSASSGSVRVSQFDNYRIRALLYAGKPTGAAARSSSVRLPARSEETRMH